MFLDPFQTCALSRSVHLEAVYLEALLYHLILQSHNRLIFKEIYLMKSFSMKIPLHLKTFWTISKLFVAIFSILDTFICQPAFLGRSRSTPFFCALSR